MGKKFRFQAKLQNIAKGMEYYAVLVPAKVTAALGTHSAIPVRARVNDSEAFIASFHPMGGGEHRLRIRNKFIQQIGAKAGDRVTITAEVRDRSAEVTLPKDLQAALRAERVLAAFESIPLGARAFLLRKIEEAVRPETRAKRIAEAVEAAHQRREK